MRLPVRVVEARYRSYSYSYVAFARYKYNTITVLDLDLSAHRALLALRERLPTARLSDSGGRG
jgi:hypothetical protein